jgi:hypothetical protein
MCSSQRPNRFGLPRRSPSIMSAETSSASRRPTPGQSLFDSTQSAAARPFGASAASVAPRIIASCSRSDADIAAESASHKRVDPWTSENRNLIVPDGSNTESAMLDGIA